MTTGKGGSHLGRLIREHRQMLSLSQADLGLLMESRGEPLSGPQLSRIENGKAQPSARQLLMLRRVLAIDAWELEAAILRDAAERRVDLSGEQPEALLEEGDSLVRSGLLLEARQRFEEAFDLLDLEGREDPDLRARLATRVGWCLVRARLFAAALGWLGRAWNARAANASTRARALVLHLPCYDGLGWDEHARLFVPEVERIAVAPGEGGERVRGLALGVLGEHRRGNADLEGAIDAFHRAEEAWRLAGEQHEVLRGRMMRALCLLDTGKVDEAEALSRSVVKEAAVVAVELLPEALVALGRAVLAGGGEAPQAVRLFERAVRLARESRREVEEFLALWNLFRLEGLSRRERERIEARLEHLALRLPREVPAVAEWWSRRGRGGEA